MNGVGTYPKDWDAIAHGVKVRAGWRCIRCGHPYILEFKDEAEAEAHALSIQTTSDHPVKVMPIASGGWLVKSGGLVCDEWCRHKKSVPEKRRVLTVAHFDDDKSNCAWWNLGALCQVCHLQFQGRVRMNQTYLYPHSAWFWHYVAGYYAHAILGEDLTRDEIVGRLCELLTLGQPQCAEFYLEKIYLEGRRRDHE